MLLVETNLSIKSSLMAWMLAQNCIKQVQKAHLQVEKLESLRLFALDWLMSLCLTEADWRIV